MEKPSSCDFLLNCLITEGILSSNPINIIKISCATFMRKTKQLKVQAAKHLIAGNYLSSKYMCQKTEVGGLFFHCEPSIKPKYGSKWDATRETAHC